MKKILIIFAVLLTAIVSVISLTRSSNLSELVLQNVEALSQETQSGWAYYTPIPDECCNIYDATVNPPYRIGYKILCVPGGIHTECVECYLNM
jgi:ABC-type transporter MlaC component